MGFNGSVFRVRSALTKLYSAPFIKTTRLPYNITKVCLVNSFCTSNSSILSGHTITNVKGQHFMSNVVRCYASKKLTAEEIAEKVLHVCKTFDKIPADKLTLDAHFMNELGLDSLDHVELIMNIEDDFNFEIPDGDAEKLLRPKDIVEYLAQKDLST